MRSARRQRIRQEAETLLRQAEVIRPPVPVEKIARLLEIRVVHSLLKDSDVSGFYFRQQDQRVIGINASHPRTRQRFTVAHELGHAILNSHDDLHVDRSFKLRDTLSSKGVDSLEIEANAFAAELLMPQQMLVDSLRKRGGLDLDDLRAVQGLAKEFDVSTQALIIRILDLPHAVTANEPW
jgi:Zn-dependent peptidase ImmA (M78 family)